TLTVSNISAGPASAVYLTDQLPSGAEVLSVKTSQGSGIAAEGIVRAELGSLRAGAQATVDVSLKFNSQSELSFNAVVRGFEPDPTPRTPRALMGAPGRPPSRAGRPRRWGRLGQRAAGGGAHPRAAVCGQLAVRSDANLQPAPSVPRIYVPPSPICNGP